jgi:plasmid segregation protein ParM
MELIVRAVDVGSGNTKFVTAAAGTDIRCASFPSVAYPSSDDSPSWPASERKKTVCIPIGPLFYEVGPDVSLAADTFRAKQLHDEYTETPEYMALLRGALSMMKVSHIDLLVVGLPVALFTVKKAALEKGHDRPARHRRRQGRDGGQGHGRGSAAGGAGALRFRAPEDGGDRQRAEPDHRPGLAHLRLAGGRGMRLVQKQSYSFNRGMSDVLRLLAAEITKDIGSPYRDYDAIDLALRTGKQPMIFQKPYDMKRLLPLAETVAEQAVSTMKEWIEAPHSLQNIILVGGGAFLFRKAVKAAFPKHRIHEVKEPMFANVRGFQLAGQNYARSSMAATGKERVQGVSGEIE